MSQVISSKEDCLYYCQNDQPKQDNFQREFAYRFNEYNPNDTGKVYPHFTNRTITASSGTCLTYSQGAANELGNGVTRYEYSNDTYNGTIEISDELTAIDGTTYIYRGLPTPQEATDYSCGDRCIKMWVHRSRGKGEDPEFFECPITVNPVSSASHPSHEVSDGIARVAAASIALSGRQHGNGTGTWTSFQLYTFG